MVRFHMDELYATAHAGLVRMYLEDEWFIEYYDKNVNGCAAYLNQAVLAWLNT
jgi:hypothetical protein